MHSMFFVCRKLFPKVQQCTYNIPQQGRKTVYSVGAVCTYGFVNCCLQRDVFNQLLIHAAMKSENKRHQKLGR